MPYGQENVRSIDEAVDATLAIKSSRPAATGVVIKTDDSAAGDGNRVVRFGKSTGAVELKAIIEALPEWYLADLAAGSVVEELITGSRVTSPRKGGTTHPYAALRNLAPGHYDIDSGQWVTLDGSPRYYESTDNLLDPLWQGRPPSEVIQAVPTRGSSSTPRPKRAWCCTCSRVWPSTEDSA